ncbi:VWA domain-containing protein [candidate division FCPU426 bacterium]|nr:VWA domain-containing protein [candidate division FCPU426 bacterium]
MHWLQPEYFYLLLLLPLFWGMEGYLSWWRRRVLIRFAAPEFHNQLFLPVGTQRRHWLKVGIWSLAFALLAMALARPQGRPVQIEQEEKMPLLYLVLDCSLSMRVQDIQPDRLRAAKTAGRKICERLPQGRIGVIAVSGEARVVCPLTDDKQAVENALYFVNPQSVERQGSDPAAGVALATEKLAVFAGAPRLVLLLSDGEENLSAALAETGKAAAAAGVRIISIGVGSLEGGKIPLGKDFWGKPQYRRHQGRLVKSRLQTMGLRKAAAVSGGKFYQWDSSQGMIQQVAGEIRRCSQETKAKAKVLAYYEYFPWLTGTAFALLLLEWCIPVRRRRLT